MKMNLQYTKKSFADRIAIMNEMYKLPAHPAPTVLPGMLERVKNFHTILRAEVDELVDVAQLLQSAGDADVLTAMADLLADITVYCRSEALKYGIPLEQVLDIVMDSNESKLGADGKPIYNEDGKFLKGPNYWAPEAKIKELLLSMTTNLE